MKFKDDWFGSDYIDNTFAFTTRKFRTEDAFDDWKTDFDINSTLSAHTEPVVVYRTKNENDGTYNKVDVMLNSFDLAHSMEDGEYMSIWDVSKVTHMDNMFDGCKKFEGKGLENWDVSNVEISSFMFLKCENLNCDLSKWDVRNIRRMSSMFSYCKKFDCDLSYWNVSNVTDMIGMFTRCKKFDCDLSNWDVSNVKDMYSMFIECENFKGKGIENWDVSKVD